MRTTQVFSVLVATLYLVLKYESVKVVKCVKLELPAGRESRCANYTGFQFSVFCWYLVQKCECVQVLPFMQIHLSVVCSEQCNGLEK